MKACTKCSEAKPLGEYYRNSSNKDGLTTLCKSCVKARNSEYWARNRERLRLANAAYYQANREHALTAAAAHRIASPHTKWEGMYRRRARIYGLDPVVESFTREDLIARWGDECFHCKGPFEELDHHPIAVAHGGEHSLENCRPSCVSCNRTQYIRTHNKKDIGKTA